MAIAYMETTRGWYDRAYDVVNSFDDLVLSGAGFDDWALKGIGIAQKPFRPMKVNPDYWAQLLEELEYMKEDVISDLEPTPAASNSLTESETNAVSPPCIEVPLGTPTFIQLGLFQSFV